MFHVVFLLNLSLMLPTSAEAAWDCGHLFARLRKSPQDVTGPAKYKLTPMIQSYQRSDRTGNVYYVPKEVRERYELRYDAEKGTWSFASDLPLVDGHYYYAMDGQGRIFVYRATEEEGAIRLQHSTLLGGEDAAAVGTLSFKDGKLAHVDSCSGHYAPTDEFYQQFLSELRERGATPETVVPIVNCL